MELTSITAKFNKISFSAFVDSNEQLYACPYAKTSDSRFLRNEKGDMIKGIFFWGSGSKSYERSLRVDVNGNIITSLFVQGGSKKTRKTSCITLIEVIK